MHSGEYDVDGEEFTIHHNGDYSGDVKIVVYNFQRRIENFPGAGKIWEQYVQVELPFELIKSIYLDYVRKRAISGIENASSDELEKMIWNIS